MNAFVEDRSVVARPARAPDATVAYGVLPEHVADVRYGSNATTLPLVLLVHGGFWRPAYDRKHTGPMCVAMADAGWTVASIEYRRIPGNPDATTGDVLDALTKLPALVQRHNGTMLAMGHSAGGHLCLFAAARNDSSQLKGALALAPAANLQLAERLRLGDGATLAFLGVPAARREDLDPTQLPQSTAPVAIIHGTQDAIVPMSVSESYVERHPKTRLKRIDNCGHFAVIDPMSHAWPQVIAELERLSRP